MMHGNTYLLYLTAAVLCLLLFYALQDRIRRRALASAGNPERIRGQVEGRSGKVLLIKRWLFFLTLSSLILTLFTQTENSPEDFSETKTNDEIVFAVDVSRSMLAEDLKPSRLIRTQVFLQEVLDQLESQQVGIVIFAGRAYPYVPLTNDRNFLNQALKNLSPLLISRQGTSFADALTISSAYFSSRTDVRKNIVIISDGEDHTKRYRSITDSLKRAGIRLFTLGVGARTGAFIPVQTENGQVVFKTNKRGNRIVSALNEKSLLEIAGTPSHYSNLEDNAKSIELIRTILSVENKKNHPGNFWNGMGRYFLLAAFIFLLLERLIPAGLRKGILR